MSDLAGHSVTPGANEISVLQPAKDHGNLICSIYQDALQTSFSLKFQNGESDT